MTNGDRIQQILNVDNDCVDVWGEDGKMFFSVTQEWWNSESDNKGEWIKVVDAYHEDGTPKSMYWKCSKCGSDSSGWGEFKFCPDCGNPKMIGGESEE